MKEKFKMTPLEKRWVLNDIGNSAFILLVATLLPIYLESMTQSAGLSDAQYLAYWGYANSIVTVLVAIIGPVCGAMADQSGYKKHLFLITTLMGVVGCAALGFVSHWLVFLAVYVVAKVGFSSSLVFYDSMLPEITCDSRADKVSALGYAWGYIGSVIPFALCLVMALGYDSFGISQVTALMLGFILTALWWLICTLPLAKSYRQTTFHGQRQGNPIAVAFRRLAKTFREAKQHKHIFLYLIAFFFFIDGVYTIIDMATAYGKALGLDSTGLLLALLVTQIVAFPATIVFGRVSSRFDTGKLIKLCILAYTGIAIFAVFLQTQWQFWVLAVLVGCFQGGIQAMSRSYLAKIVPVERSAEYYGLMDICGKGASFVGTTMIAVISQTTDGMSFSFLGLKVENTGLAVGSLVILFVIGYLLFCKADSLRKKMQ